LRKAGNRNRPRRVESHNIPSSNGGVGQHQHVFFFFPDVILRERIAIADVRILHSME
jgi:hypothetical protein